MTIRLWRFLLVLGAAMTVAACGSKETKEALEKATTLSEQKQYQDANVVLVNALRAREALLRQGTTAPTDAAGADALTKKVQADSEVLKMERAQIAIYLHLGRADLASAVYTDILAGNPSDKVVFELVHDKDPTVRTGAVRVLGLSGQPQALDALIAATKDEDKDVRRSAVAALGQIKNTPATVDPLIAALKDSYWFVRSDAADALGRAKDPRAIPALLDVVADPDSTTESSAESALILICKVSHPTPEPFAQRLNDPNAKIVRISAICLAVLKDGRSIPVLMKLLVSEDMATKLNAVKALGETGDPSVIPTLRQTLKDPDINMRGWSIIGLGNLKDTQSVNDLQAIADNDKESPNIRAAANAAVQHIKGDSGSAPAAAAP